MISKLLNQSRFSEVDCTFFVFFLFAVLPTSLHPFFLKTGLFKEYYL